MLVHARPDAAAIAAADENWVTMHGPKIEMRRRKGEENFAAAEAAIGLAILVVYFRNRGSIAVEDVNLMKG